jgi:hypothetical protein
VLLQRRLVARARTAPRAERIRISSCVHAITALVRGMVGYAPLR